MFLEDMGMWCSTDLAEFDLRKNWELNKVSNIDIMIYLFDRILKKKEKKNLSRNHNVSYFPAFNLLLGHLFIP